MRYPRLLAVASDDDRRFRGGIAFHIIAETAAEIGVADVGTHGAIQSAPLPTMEDAGVSIPLHRHAANIEVDERVVGHRRVCLAESSDRAGIQEPIVAAVPAAVASAE